MKVNSKTNIDIWHKTVPTIAAEISAALGGPIQRGTTLLLSKDEEAAFDKLFGMAWPVVIADAVAKAASQPGKKSSWRCNIEFPDDHHICAAYV